MSQTVWKYLIHPDRFELDLPAGAEVLHVDVQAHVPQAWVLVDPEQPTERRRFRLVGTGHPIPEPPFLRRHVGSFLTHQGALVFHLFEILGAVVALEAIEQGTGS